MAVRVGVISDTHLTGVSDKLRSIFETYLAQTDIILHAGDIVALDALEVFKGIEFFAVHGNMDPKEVRSVLPPSRFLEVGGYRLGLIHGWGSPSGLEERVLSNMKGADIIIFGHSHLPTRRWMGGVFLFNPGTATGYTFTGSNTIGILEIGDDIKAEIIEV